MKKKRTHLRIYQPPYPNAATPQYITDKILNILTAVASGTGFITVLFFIFLL